jgi:diguanylate cyclase (GGDEF)-like protein
MDRSSSRLRPATADPVSTTAPASPLTPDGDLDRIIGRKDIAMVPWAGIALCAGGVAISTALRPDADGFPDRLLIPAALIYGAIATLIVATQRTRLMEWFARQLSVYVLGSILLIAVLSVLAAGDHGLATVFYAPSIPIAMYLGLVLPRRWSSATIAMQMFLGGVVHHLTPDASALDSVTVLALTLAGWGVGLMCRGAHRRAARVALLLSRSDVLTRTLNRRGFFEQFEAELAVAAERRTPVALLVVDLDDFKRVNDEAGHNAGDAVLRWVGDQFPQLVPDGAAVGRLGGDDFGVVVTGASRSEAHTLAQTIADQLGRRISVSIGIATSEDGAANADDFLRIADAALYQAKAGAHERVAALVAGSTLQRAGTRRLPRTPLTYGQLVAAGGPPDRPLRHIHYGRLIRGGLWTIAGCGVFVVVGTILQGPANGWGQIVISVGPFWIVANVLGGWLFPGTDDADGTHERAAVLVPTITLGFGLSIAVMAGGGLTAPLVAAFYLKVLFDAVVLRRDRAYLASGALLLWWLAVVALSPPSQYWAIPYQLILFGVSHWLGRVGRAAFTEATRARLRIAHTDPLTALRNRSGFLQGAGRALAIAKTTDLPYGLLAFDLDGFKRLNDDHGHAAGDRLLCAVADLIRELFPEAHSIARLGGDEFVIALPLESPDHAADAIERLEDALPPTVGASIGWSLLLDDGFELEPLMQAADRRSYRAKLQRPRSLPIALYGQSDDPIAAA